MPGSRINPKLLAWAQMNGAFDFDRTPLAPPGVRAIVHEKPDKRSSWSPHGLDGWHVGPALDSYRCCTTWTWDTRSIRICDALSWFPTKVSMPIASSNDLMLASIKDILEALRNPTCGSPLDPLTDSHVTALLQVLSDLITGLIPVPIETTLDPEPGPAPPLRVAITPQTPSPLRVDPIITSPTPLFIPDDTTVVAPPAPVQPAAASPSVPPTCPNVTHDDSPPFLEPTINASPAPNAPLDTVPTVPLDPVPLASPVTFDNSTGPKGRRRQQTARGKKASPKNYHTRDTRAQSRQPEATANLIQQHPLPFAMHSNAFNPDTGKIAQRPELSRCSAGHLWQASNTKEIGRLAQGVPDNAGTDTMFFIPVSVAPKGRKATYLNVISAFRPEKKNPHRVGWTCSGDQVDYPGLVSTQMADLTTVKILINSVLSAPKAKMVVTNLKDFCLGAPMERYEHMRIPVRVLPPKIMELCASYTISSTTVMCASKFVKACAATPSWKTCQRPPSQAP
jgi:hypothetical protein